MTYTEEEYEIANILLKMKEFEDQLEILYEKWDGKKKKCSYLGDGIGECDHPVNHSCNMIPCNHKDCPLINIRKNKEEKKMDKKYVQLRVVMTKDFMIPVSNEYPEDQYTLINGWPIERIIEDWFKNNRICSHHAAREAYSISGSEQFIKALEMEIIE